MEIKPALDLVEYQEFKSNEYQGDLNDSEVRKKLTERYLVNYQGEALILPEETPISIGLFVLSLAYFYNPELVYQTSNQFIQIFDHLKTEVIRSIELTKIDYGDYLMPELKDGEEVINLEKIWEGDLSPEGLKRYLEKVKGLIKTKRIVLTGNLDLTAFLIAAYIYFPKLERISLQTNQGMVTVKENGSNFR